MPVEDVDTLVEALRSRAGGALRCVAEYDEDGYHLAYVREDITSTARLGQLADDIHSDLVLQGIGREHLENLFEAGSLHCSMHRFDDLTAFHFVSAEHTGLFVSLDSNADVPLASFAGDCEAHL
jgi:hypothetical protein